MRQAIYPILFSVAFAMMSRPAASQKTAPRIKFSSINSIGLVSGGNGQAAKLETINGIALRQFFVGAGVAIDYYATRSVPLFIDVRRTLSSKQNAPFVYAEGGWNFSWATQNQQFAKGYNAISSSGMIAEGGVGLELHLKNARAIILSAGYSLKTMKDKAEAYSIWSFPTPEPSYDYYKYNYQRIVLKAGLRL